MRNESRASGKQSQGKVCRPHRHWADILRLWDSESDLTMTKVRFTGAGLFGALANVLYGVEKPRGYPSARKTKTLRPEVGC